VRGRRRPQRQRDTEGRAAHARGGVFLLLSHARRELQGQLLGTLGRRVGGGISSQAPSLSLPRCPVFFSEWPADYVRTAIEVANTSVGAVMQAEGGMGREAGQSRAHLPSN
jgi:hypothetical protein